MTSNPLLRLFRDLPLRRKFMLMLGVLAIGIIVLCVVTARRNHIELIQNERDTLHTRVEAALAMANHYADRADAGELSEEQAQQQALSALESLRSANGSDYVWVNDLHPTMLMHPYQTALNGKDLSATTSADGKKIFVEMVRLGRADGGGFLDYTWPKPGTDGAVQKISYVGLHQRWGWIIGTGEYTDEINAHAARFTRGLAIAGLLILLSALLPCLYIARSILQPLSEASRAIRAVATGDLSPRVANHSRDEIGQMHQDIGNMVLQLRARNERDLALATENLRIRTALDDVTTNIMIADADLNILYANRSLFQMLEKAEHDIRRDLPRFNTTTLIGSNIDSFHKKPAHQRHVLGELRGTHRGQISLGDHVLRQIINPVRDPDGALLGYVVEWADRTDEVAVEHELSRIVEAAGRGDLSGHIALEGKEGFLKQLSGQLNDLLETFTGSIGQVSGVLTALAKGDLTVRMEGDFEGVFARMRDDANTTIAQLTTIIGDIQGAASGINLAATEIASGNQDLSQRTEQQAANLEETAASMEELTSTVRQNAEHARQANQLAIGAASVASEGGAVVGQVVTTMSEIEQSSKKIADIISVIDGIAFQTNILALNAAVEAARAGEQGRGFAVVASEVRTLAQRSAGAAKEIKGLIDASVERVADGSALVRKAGQTMGEIVSSVQRVTDIMAEISAASQEQTTGIEQVSQTVMQMDETTQQNAALVEEATAAARSMEEQAHNLANAVTRFKLSQATPLPGIAIPVPPTAPRTTPTSAHSPHPLPAGTRPGSNWTGF
ncbi:methyl-accepting chemotaxis protein [Stenotrophomonas sp. YIM B06876]|uniref:methyl-accepting chemotaxis protein n=1 Tax=Stenotrophomonas sp. YIM B06876 TaxID=3060211 RepID=UPI002738F9B4|nr:methyl-accepting chemotaxis protein [Stenotrophomonas sp. YIM B06876]